MTEERCRLVLIANPGSAKAEELADIARTKAVACCILYNKDQSQKDFQKFCEEVVGHFQAEDIAVLVSSDTQAMGRSNADGLYVEANHAEISNLVGELQQSRMIGCGNFKKRHDVLEVGEIGIDVVLMGKLGADTKPEPHPRNIQMARWCSEILDIPNIVLGGNTIESVIECAQAGSEFVALETAIFASNGSPVDAILKADKLLEEHAPRFEEASA